MKREHRLDTEVDAIRLRAAAFRRAIESTSFGSETPQMQHFPTECCHHACKLLGLYLYECGMGVCQIYTGDHPTCQSAQHHWLRKQDIDIDITADQFGQPAVIVDRASSWHKCLNGKPSPRVVFDADYWMGIKSRRYHGIIYPLIVTSISGTQ